jgi:molecular chaperone GrpE
MSEQTSSNQEELNQQDAQQVETEATAGSTEETIESLREQLEQAQAQLAEKSEQVLRAHAEADNVRRRAERDVQNAHKFALEGFVESLLPVLDSLEQGLAQPATNDESKALKQGMELTLKMFIDVLAKKNVEQIDPVGQTFNPELHEAMSMQENPDYEPNTVIAVFQKGYLLNGRVVRPARVVVNKGKSAQVDQTV